MKLQVEFIQNNFPVHRIPEFHPALQLYWEARTELQAAKSVLDQSKCKTTSTYQNCGRLKTSLQV